MRGEKLCQLFIVVSVPSVPVLVTPGHAVIHRTGSGGRPNNGDQTGVKTWKDI